MGIDRNLDLNAECIHLIDAREEEEHKEQNIADHSDHCIGVDRAANLPIALKNLN